MSSSFFVGNNDYCETTRSTSNMLERFQQDRHSVISLLKNDPDRLVSILWSVNSPVSKDDDCLFAMGKSLAVSIDDILSKTYNTSDSLTNFYICPQCKNMKRIIDFPRIKANDPFMLECGEKAGSYLTYNQNEIRQLYIVKENQPLSVTKALAHPGILELAKCSSASCPVPTNNQGRDFLNKISKMNYIGSDPFTNNMLINWYINDEIKFHFSNKFPNITTSLISFICNNEGYYLSDYNDIGIISSFQDYPEFLDNFEGKPSPTAKADDKSSISKSIVLGIIVQLFSVLHFLRKYDFSHGNPATTSLKFKKEVVSYISDGVHVTCPVALKLEDFRTSGCTVTSNNIRLYSKSIIADEVLKKKTIIPIVETNNYEGGNVTVYRLKDPIKYVKSKYLFLYMKHLGLPVYASSFDAYSFMIVLMCERAFYTSVMSDSKLKTFWKNMWISKEDFNIISERITNYHEKTTPIESLDVFKILTDINLRCDMIDFGWEKIRTF